jgi:hypothetical protein
MIEKYQIFCDMDGVLVDLVRGVGDAIYSEPPENSSENYKKAQQKAREALDGKPLRGGNLDKNSSIYKKETKNFLMRVMNNDRRFWINLKWMPGGKKLWDYIKKYDPVILSRPTDLQAVIGKKKWVKDNLGLTKERVQIRYDKSPYANHQGKIGILIDDFEKNTNKFDKAGGQTILYKNPDQAIDELKSLGF